MTGFNSRSFLSSSFLVKIFVVMVLTIAIVLTAFGCSDSNDKSGAFDIGTGPITTKAKDPITKEAVEALVTRKLGDAGNAGQPVIRSVTLTPDANGNYVNIELNRTASCHAGALVGTATNMSQQVMSALFRYPDVSRIQLSLYGTTEDLKDKDKLGVRILVNKDAASKIDWFQFKDTTVSTLASEFWVEPTIYANWQQYGGAPIADEATRQAANTGGSTTTP